MVDSFIEARALQLGSWGGADNATIREALSLARDRTVAAANSGRRQLSAGATAVARWVEPKDDSDTPEPAAATPPAEVPYTSMNPACPPTSSQKGGVLVPRKLASLDPPSTAGSNAALHRREPKHTGRSISVCRNRFDNMAIVKQPRTRRRYAPESMSAWGSTHITFRPVGAVHDRTHKEMSTVVAAQEASLQKILEGTSQYLVPLYQRPYRWGRTTSRSCGATSHGWPRTEAMSRPTVSSHRKARSPPHSDVWSPAG
ncbi:hypothetical protein B7C42_07967 [Nocardia cerradoensis]|uniref:Uncharacterized protein n=1 Tax=Nocardia cerradoensis TaxID=85688 RepID=A0A231GTL1_9NOCA|nr:hypothetical protein B7C42_07967 [Nocardia cerradoensis]